jgi:hypothetical protein
MVVVFFSSNKKFFFKKRNIIFKLKKGNSPPPNSTLDHSLNSSISSSSTSLSPPAFESKTNSFSPSFKSSTSSSSSFPSSSSSSFPSSSSSFHSSSSSSFPSSSSITSHYSNILQQMPIINTNSIKEENNVMNVNENGIVFDNAGNPVGIVDNLDEIIGNNLYNSSSFSSSSSFPTKKKYILQRLQRVRYLNTENNHQEERYLDEDSNLYDLNYNVIGINHNSKMGDNYKLSNNQFPHQFTLAIDMIKRGLITADNSGVGNLFIYLFFFINNFINLFLS